MNEVKSIFIKFYDKEKQIKRSYNLFSKFTSRNMLRVRFENNDSGSRRNMLNKTKVHWEEHIICKNLMLML